MAVPFSNNPDDVRQFLQELDDRLSALETPRGPIPAWPTARPLPDAAEFKSAVVLVIDLGVLAVSDGSRWVRQDTGGTA